MGTDPLVARLTEELVVTCRKAFQRGLVGGAGGNISVRVPDRDEVLISATGVSLGDITGDAVVRIDLTGRVIEAAGGCRPSKETGFHVTAYRLRRHVGAVVHLHPPFATAFAVRGKALGVARVILTGTRESRLEVGKRVGADFTINVRTEKLADRVREITGGKGADSVLECAGGPTSMQEALENVKRGGRIGVVAWYQGPVEMDMNLAVRSNVRIYAARGEGGMNCGRSLALMSAGKIVADPIITHHFSLDQIHEAFRTYVERIGDALKVVIHV